LRLKNIKLKLFTTNLYKKHKPVSFKTQWAILALRSQHQNAWNIVLESSLFKKHRFYKCDRRLDVELHHQDPKIRSEFKIKYILNRVKDLFLLIVLSLFE